MKNSIAVALVALIILGNGAVAALRLDAVNGVNDRQTGITALESANTSLQSAITALQAEQNQAALAVAALEALVEGNSSGPVAAVPKYGTLIAQIDPVVVKFTATGGLRGFGSGILVTSNGYVLTVLHSVTGAGNIKIILNTGEQFDATIFATDVTTNLALLKINTNRTNLPFVNLGSMAALSTGQIVMAAGYPQSADLPGPATFTIGIVSALRTATDFNYIQSDAPIAPGSGGGGLFTLDGKVVGIAATAEPDTNGIFEFIPIDLAVSLLASITG